MRSMIFGAETGKTPREFCVSLAQNFELIDDVGR